MSNQFKLVSAIIADVRYQADIEGLDDRHPTANLLRSFNDSAQKLRTKLTDWGYDHFLVPTSTATLPIVPAATGETYAEIDWPKDAARIYQIHVQFETNLWLPLKPISLSGIRDYQQTYRGRLGVSQGPAAFALRQAPFGAAAVETVGKIMLVPVPQVARNYRMFYLPNWSDLGVNDTFNGHEGHIQWIVYDMVVKIAVRDNDSSATYGMAMQERANIEQMLAKSAPRTQSASSQEPRRDDGEGYDEWFGMVV
jgi:hypothetical protein